MIKYEVEVYDNGTKSWYLKGELHREDGPAVEYANGDKSWYLKGKLHREDGPASEWANGTKRWYLNGNLHREDGPAIEHADGTKCWYLKGEELTETEHRVRTLPTVKTASSKPMFEVSEISENSHDGSATLVIDMSPEMTQIALTKGVNAILRDALDALYEVEGWTG